MNQQLTLFDLPAGEEEKALGKARAALSRAKLLELGRDVAKRIARARATRACSADDVYQKLIDMGHDPAPLGPAAGSLFGKEDWIFRGEWVRSERVSNHARVIRVWRLKEGK